MLDESGIYVAREQFLNVILRIREDSFKTWESQLRGLLDIAGYTLNVRMRKVDLAWCIRGGIGGMDCSQGLRELVKETIILVDLFSRYLAMRTKIP